VARLKWIFNYFFSFQACHGLHAYPRKPWHTNISYEKITNKKIRQKKKNDTFEEKNVMKKEKSFIEFLSKDEYEQKAQKMIDDIQKEAKELNRPIYYAQAFPHIHSPNLFIIDL
jgi:arsenate reductase-like glutaredoxin family protein